MVERIVVVYDSKEYDAYVDYIKRRTGLEDPSRCTDGVTTGQRLAYPIYFIELEGEAQNCKTFYRRLGRKTKWPHYMAKQEYYDSKYGKPIRLLSVRLLDNATPDQIIRVDDVYELDFFVGALRKRYGLSSVWWIKFVPHEFPAYYVERSTFKDGKRRAVTLLEFYDHSRDLHIKKYGLPQRAYIVYAEIAELEPL